MNILQEIKTITKNTDDELLNLLINKAKAEVLTYTKLTEYHIKLDNVVTDIVVEKLNRMGTEGLQSQGYSGVSESYTDGYSKQVMQQLNAFKKNVRLL